MSDKYNDLLLAALQRAGKPRTSGQLLDAATGLALAEGWDTEQRAKLSRKSVAKRLQGMESRGLVRAEGSTFDEDQGRMTPLFLPVSGYDARALVPAPPSTEHAPSSKASTYDGLNRSQLLAVLDVHDAFAECIGRFMADLSQQREKARQRLLAVGVEID